MSRFLVLQCLLPLLCFLAPCSGGKVELHLRYRFFEDYLTNMDKLQQAYITGDRVDANLMEGSGEAEEGEGVRGRNVGSVRARPLPIRTGSTRSKKVACCMLGQLAGDKGYHCYAKFYAARMMFRNYNRAHNKKIAGLQYPYSMSRRTGSVRDSADKLMRTFSQCVTHEAQVFHKCCHLSAIDNNPSNPKSLKVPSPAS